MLHILVQLPAGGEAVLQGRLLSEAQALRLRKQRSNAVMLVFQAQASDCCMSHCLGERSSNDTLPAILERAMKGLRAWHKLC